MTAPRFYYARRNQAQRFYRGVIIERCGHNASGMRWNALTPAGMLRADTLAGIKELIRMAVQS